MARTLLIMRHGKSRWDEEGLDDHDRSLAKRGKQDSVAMGEKLLARGLVPDVILCSTAKRARSTARRVVKASGYKGQVLRDARLYFQGVEPCLSAIASLDDEAETALVVGHNPVSEELVQLLTGESVRLPTAAIACIDLPISAWRFLDQTAKGTLRLVLSPQRSTSAE